jgi:hypothetical protein
MPKCLWRCRIIMFLFFCVATRGVGQNYTTPAPDGSPAATFAAHCVTSKFFQFGYKLPEDEELADLSLEPDGGVDPTHRTFVLFKSSRAYGISRDVIDVAAEDRRTANNPSAASWMRALHNLNTNRKDVPAQGEVEYLTIAGQDFARLRFQQSRDDGVITYEAAYAFGARGYVVFFMLGSVDQARLGLLEKTFDSFSPGTSLCSAPR